MSKWETLGKINVDVNGSIEVVDIRINMNDSTHRERWYEMALTLSIKTLWAGDVEIKHNTIVRHTLTYDEVETLKEKGLIKDKINKK